MRFINEPLYDLTYDDVFMAPSHSELTSRMDVDLPSSDGSSSIGSGKCTVIIDSWVSKLGGRKEIESTPGKGFTLRVLIP